MVRVSANHLTSLQPLTSTFAMLHTLDASSNTLSQLPVALCRLPTLRSLILSSNRVRVHR